ncbi:MAG: hypothetical protein UR89_C0002G0015 [Candidatus Roizmanbacteria bacterium GW2011_GWA2_35_8]|uniref:HD/PDEase domain-containing protein n=1 Tax=Candidatus Roizmanbacteria bacterium GW2011_GWA2_35_8 TaxID=1618479 RepID=A0A0G0FIJ8_9BACT|nr:MAG: hypothetical protein UR89_C0002G0015 [Candidatus Roizmanbacteria bacterium GW2011_GWA2_35_8]
MHAKLENFVTFNESPRNTIESIILSTVPPITRSIRFYEFEKNKPRSLLDQLGLLPKSSPKNLTLNLLEGLLAPHERLTYDHSIEVGVMSWAMGSLLGLDPERCFKLGLLHDVGKLGINSNTLSLRFLLNFNKIWNEEHTKLVSLHHVLNDDEKDILHRHGIFGQMILKHLGFDIIFQQIARDHGRESLTFQKNEPLELMVVTLADWFSAIKNFNRNQSRKTDWGAIGNAKEQMEKLFSDEQTNLPEKVKEAFWDMIEIFKIYPPLGNEEGEILYWYRLFNSFRKDVSALDRGKPIRSFPFFTSLPDLKQLKDKIKTR